jgi:glucokinase
MLLAGDVGGTKTLLGLFEANRPRPEPVAAHTYPTNEFDSFGAILDAFAREVARPFSVHAATIGVAGPVVGRRASLTNIDWDLSCDEVADRLRTPHVALLNDLAAMATSVPLLTEDECVVLQEGTARDDGNAAVIAAGTGLGQAYLHRVGGQWLPVASEGGHADFAPRTDREIELVRMLRERYGRAEVEHVLSGPGLVNLHRFTHRGGECDAVGDLDAPEAPARVSQAGLAGRCQFCADALRMFAAAYGSEAGNLALRGVATAGIFVGGGIAPKILPVLRGTTFIDAFRSKPPMADLLAGIPVKVILKGDAGLLGAAVHAATLGHGPG